MSRRSVTSPGASRPTRPGTYDDFDAWNARFVEQQSGVKVADIIDELDASHRAFVAAASALPEALFKEDAAGRGLLDGAGTGHYREHTRRSGSGARSQQPESRHAQSAPE